MKTPPFQYILIFQNLIQALEAKGSGNVVIGGSQALIAHGLEIGRSSADIDVIVYRPTEEQMSFLRSMSDFDLMSNPIVGSSFGEYGGRRCMKFKKDGHTIDILVEVAEGVPSDLLYLKTPLGTYYKVQSVANVVKAKQSYSFDSSTEPMHYTRRKDVVDLIALKNLNFNYIP